MIENNSDVRNKKQLMAIIGAGVTCLFVLLPFSVVFEWDFIFTLPLIAIIALSLFWGVMAYLHTSIRRDNLFSRNAQSNKEIQDPDQSYEAEFNLSNRLSQIEDELADLSLSSQDVSASQRSKLVQKVRQSIVETANNEFLDEIRNSIQDSKSGQKFAKDIRLIFNRTIERLNNEVESLARRGNLNLALGILTALAGIALLAFFVWNPGRPNGSPMEFVQNFLPRISLVILVEVFAYFFLRLYSNSLIEIKYFQNELTNVEAKFLSLIAATHIENENNMTDVISQLSQTERNYILHKGQTTVNLERSKMEKETISNLTKNFIKVISRRT